MLVHSFMRGSRNFVRGMGGPGQSDNVFLVLSLFTGVKWSFSKKPFILQGSRGGPTFSRGSNFFQGGGESNCLFPIETHITCDFPGGGGPDPLPPLDPHLFIQSLIFGLIVHIQR